MTGQGPVALVLPLLLIGALGWLVPRLLGAVWPEGVRPLLLLALVATVILTLLSAGVFLLLYRSQGASFAALLADGAGIGHFLRLGLLSALVWAPVMILTVASLPKRWVKETW